MAAAAPIVTSIDSTIIDAFFVAVKTGDVVNVIYILESNKEYVEELINAKDNDGKTALNILTAPYPVSSGPTMFFSINFAKGLFPIIDILLQAGAAVEQLNEHSLIIIFEHACCVGNLEVVARCAKCFSELYKDGETFSEKLTYGFSTACEKGYMNIVQYLVNCGLDPKRIIMNIYPYYTPLQIACRSGQYDVVKALVETYKVNVDRVESPDNFSPIIHAAINGHLEILRLLIKNGASLKTNCKGLTLLHYVCKCCEKNVSYIIRLLVEAGENIDIKTADGKTPLDLARDEGKVEVEDFFVKRGTLIVPLIWEQLRQDGRNFMENFPPEHLVKSDSMFPSIQKAVLNKK